MARAVRTYSRAGGALILQLTAALALASCTIGDGSSPSDDRDATLSDAPSTVTTVVTPTSSTAAEEPDPAGSEARTDDAALKDAVAAAIDTYGGQAGIAVFDGAEVHSAGTTEGYPAWSTSKVPVAIAAQRAGVADAHTISQAITYSDNQAAESLRAALGDPAAAGAAANEVLRDGGDEETTVQTEKVRPEFTAFGQTHWGLENQARFAHALPEIAGAGPVLEAMRADDPAQAYGLRTLDGAALKGGWGPDETGAYDVVQIGRVQLGGKDVGVAVYAHAGDGTYETAQQELSYLAQKVSGEKSGTSAH